MTDNQDDEDGLMTTTTDPSQAFLAQVQTATSVVHIHRSSFPSSDPFSADFDAAVGWLRANRPAVDLQILVDPLMADPVVFMRTDTTCWAGPLLPPMTTPWIHIPITTDQFDQFFTDEANSLAHPDTILPYNATPPLPDGATLINDFSRLNPTSVKEVVGYKQQRWPWSAFKPTEADFCNVVADTARAGGTISIAGKRHSQGGHTFFTDSVVLDITDFDEILAFYPEAKTIRVQSGITWDAVQRFVQPHGLSVSVMQAYPFFTVGGALAVSVHESDLRFGTIIDTVLSFRILLADGHVLDVSRETNSDLFGLVIGGYGLLGLVLEVELQLTDDLLLTQTVKTVAAADFTELFLAAKATPGTIFGYARPCFVDDDRLMTQMSMVTYAQATPTPPPGIFEIADLSYLGLRKLIYDLSRSYEWGKVIKWDLQQQYGDDFNVNLISRNNLMRADIRIPGDYRSSTDTDALQEYFVPVGQYAAFATGLAAILRQFSINMMSLGIRYVPETTASKLSYSPKGDVFGAIMVINHGTSIEQIANVEGWTRQIIDLVLSLGGTYYLPYAAYASRDQAHAAYPLLTEFLAAKDRYDPNHLFMNWFFHNYG